MVKQYTPKQIAAAKAALASLRPPTIDLASASFPKQLAFLQDPSRFKTACCSRRAGKSIGCALDLCHTATSMPGIACLYFTVTRGMAERIIWGPLKQINEAYGLGGVCNESKLTMTFPNKSVIYLSGAKDKTEIAKYLGFPLKLVYGDEAQSFRGYLEELVEESIAPTLIDRGGTMVLMGTPGPVPVGYFYNTLQLSKGWSHHAWTFYDNEPLKAELAHDGRSPESEVAAYCERRGLTMDSPVVQRHFFGKWANDPSALVFRWSEANDYNAVDGGSLQYVVGVDLGFRDADALAVLGWNKTGVYLVEEVVTRKQGVTALAKQIADVNARYSPQAIVMDAGGLGLKIVDEIQDRYSLPVQAAKKTDKYSHIELVNDALRLGTLKVRKDSVFAQDSFLLQWDKDKSSGDKLVVSDTFHSDVCDALLYAFRECMNWVPDFDKTVKPRKDTEDYIEARALEVHKHRQTQEQDPWALESAWLA